MLAASVHALLIGISDYPDPGGWSDLHSRNDLAAIHAALEARGVPDDHITTLEDSAATKTGALDALAALGDRVRPGDHVYVHYSGHGQQLRDDGDDESDGLDESLALFDAPRAVEAAYAGERHLRDDELGRALDVLRDRAGSDGSVVVALDSCYSATATRGEARIRGGAPPIGPPRRAGAEGPAEPGRGAAPMVVLTAARADQLAREVVAAGVPMGALSSALAETLASGAPLPSWAAVFERVRAEMAAVAPGQQPTLEGEGRIGVLGTPRVDAGVLYHSVTAVISDRRVRIDAGRVHGVESGARVELHASGARGPEAATRLATGTVVAAGLGDATIDLDASVGGRVAEAARVFVTARALPEYLLRVALSGLDPAWDTAITTAPFVVRDNRDPDLVLERVNGRDVLRRPDAWDELASAPSSAPDRSPVLVELLHFARARTLAEIELTAPDYATDVGLLASNATSSSSCVATDDSLEAIRVGQAFQIALTRTGSAPGYVTVAWFAGDGRAVQIWPGAGLLPERLDPGRSWTIPVCLRGTLPTGIERIMVFTTRKPLVLDVALGQPPTRGREMSETLQLLVDAAASGDRGAVARPGAASEGHTATLVVETIDP